MNKVKIAWITITGQRCEKQVEESEASAEMDHIRSLPDVKPETVHLEF